MYSLNGSSDRKGFSAEHGNLIHSSGLKDAADILLLAPELICELLGRNYGTLNSLSEYEIYYVLTALGIPSLSSSAEAHSRQENGPEFLIDTPAFPYTSASNVNKRIKILRTRPMENSQSFQLYIGSVAPFQCSILLRVLLYLAKRRSVPENRQTVFCNLHHVICKIQKHLSPDDWYYLGRCSLEADMQGDTVLSDHLDEILQQYKKVSCIPMDLSAKSYILPAQNLVCAHFTHAYSVSEVLALKALLQLDPSVPEAALGAWISSLLLCSLCPRPDSLPEYQDGLIHLTDAITDSQWIYYFDHIFPNDLSATSLILGNIESSRPMPFLESRGLLSLHYQRNLFRRIAEYLKKEDPAEAKVQPSESAGQKISGSKIGEFSLQNIYQTDMENCSFHNASKKQKNEPEIIKNSSKVKYEEA